MSSALDSHDTSEGPAAPKSQGEIEGKSDRLDEQSLFLKPDDIHDINDVSRLRPEIVDLLRTKRDQVDSDSLRQGTKKPRQQQVDED